MPDYKLYILCLLMCCGSRLSVSLHIITNVAVPPGQNMCFLPWNENCYCASRTTTCVFCHGMKTVPVPAGQQHVFSAMEWKLLLCQQDNNMCFSASKYRFCCMYSHRTTNSVSLPRNKNYCWTMICVYMHQNYKCFCSILWPFYTSTDNDIHRIIDVDAQLKFIIINDLGMSEMRCFKIIPHNLIMLFVV